MAQDEADFPHAVPILTYHPDEDIRYTLDEEALERILQKEEIYGLPLMVFSIVGIARTGKSFFLNFVVSYLEHMERGIDEEWNHLQTRLDSFNWNGAVERVTSGILMWSKPFIIQLKNGTRVAILVMDTQGTFDDHTRHADGASIFALSTLMSSLQVHNVMRSLNESDLQHLALFTSIAMGFREREDTELFQNLKFLMRDWPHARQHPFGAEGGSNYIDNKLQVENREGEHLEIRRNIRSAFANISGFNLPKPGDEVEENDAENIDLTQLRGNFVSNLKEFLVDTFSEENLVFKTINGRNIYSDHLFRLIQAWAGAFGGNRLPAMEDVFMRTMRADDESAMEHAMRLFITDMREYTRVHADWDTNTGRLRGFFADQQTHAEQFYLEAPGIGNFRQRREGNLDVLTIRLINEFTWYLEFALNRRAPGNARGNYTIRNYSGMAWEIVRTVVPHLVLLVYGKVTAKPTPPPPPPRWFSKLLKIIEKQVAKMSNL